MGGKPRKKPRSQLTFEDLISGFDRIDIGGEFWEVVRRLGPDHKTKEFKMGITRGEYKRITRGPNKGGHQMTLTVVYMDDTDEAWVPWPTRK